MEEDVCLLEDLSHLLSLKIFLINFGLESARDLPGLKELKSAGLLDSRPPPGSPELSDEKVAENDEQQTELFNSEDVK